MKPILFNTQMVRAILDGRKTQTRRIIKSRPRSPRCPGMYRDGEGVFFGWYQDGIRTMLTARPRYQPGDILYVRETWTKLYYVDPDGYTHFDQPMYYYAADGTPDITLRDADGFELEDQRIRWRPSIHMPREAARLFLRVSDVRVERLQDITNADCVSEGAVKRPNMTKRGDLVLHNRYRKEFGELWDTTIKPADRDRYGWDANPWVWVISFERYDPADPEGGADG